MQVFPDDGISKNKMPFFLWKVSYQLLKKVTGPLNKEM